MPTPFDPAAFAQRQLDAYPGMQIVRLLATDAARYRTLMLHAYACAPDAFTSTADERAKEPDSWWVSRIADPRGLSQAFGAIGDDGELVGTVTIEYSAKPKTRHKALLIGMFVHERLRGQHIGQALVKAALADAAARPGVRVVTLTVTEGNAPAIALYERCGFSSFGTEPMAIATPAGLLGKVHMGLDLAAPRADAAHPGPAAANVTVRIDGDAIRDWPTFHDAFAAAFGFPAFYGRNMDAWNDCMGSLSDPAAGMTRIHVPDGAVLSLVIDNAHRFKAACPAQYEALVECSAFVNWRLIERGYAPVLALAFHA